MKKKKGFSLIELIVVMAVMAILVLIAAPRYLGYTKEAKERHITADVKSAESVLAIYMATHNDEMPSGSVEIAAANINAMASAGEIYGKSGVINSLSGTDVYYALSDKSIRSLSGTKLGGTFIMSEAGGVYYFDGTLTEIAENDAPSIELAVTADTSKMLATITYPASADALEYSIDGGAWQKVDTSLSMLPKMFSLTVNAASPTKTYTQVLDYSSTLVARAVYEKSISQEVSTTTYMPRGLAAPTGTSSGTASYDIEVPEGSISQYRLGTGAWIDFTKTLSIDQNGSLQIRCIDANGKVTAYGSTEITGLTKAPEAALSLSNSGTILTTTALNWDTTGTKTYFGATISLSEWQIDNQTVTNTPPVCIISPGIHTVKYRVKDSNEIWSNWAMKQLNVFLPLSPLDLANSSNIAGTGNVTSGVASSHTVSGVGGAYAGYKQFSYSDKVSVSFKVKDYTVTSGDKTKIALHFYMTRVDGMIAQIVVYDEGSNFRVIIVNAENTNIVIPKSDGVFVVASQYSNNLVYVNGKIYDISYSSSGVPKGINAVCIQHSYDNVAGSATSNVESFGVANTNYDLSALLQY